MSDVTQILSSVGSSKTQAAEELLPLVYEELRRLANARMAHEKPGQTLQPTALVHEVWIKLSGQNKEQWAGRSQFFAAAAEAMRRILIDRARQKQALKRGANADHVLLEESQLALAVPTEEMLAVHDALDQLAEEDAQAAALVKLRYFVGLNMAEAADALELSRRASERLWQFARAWLRGEISDPSR